MPGQCGGDIAQIQFPVFARRRDQLGASGEKFRRATFIGLAVGPLVANYAVIRAAQMREGERVGGSAVENEEDFAVLLENFADPRDNAPGPSVVTVGNFRVSIRFRERVPPTKSSAV